MALSVGFTTPFFSGQTISTDVPNRFDFALAGRGYMIDTKQQLVRQSIPPLRNQIDTSGTFGEQSLGSDDLVRRSVDGWDHGAGQERLDREDSDPRRFRSSKGVDVWTRWSLGLLPDTASKLASASTNLMLVTAGTHLYLTDGADLRYTTSLTGTPTWTAVTGLPSSPVGVATDGYNVWTAHGASGVYRTTRGGAASSSYNTTAATVIGYANGRLMAAYDNILYNLVDTVAPATALYTHPNDDFRWVGFSEGQTALYAAGYSGDKSTVFRISVLPDGTGLDQPVVATTLPDGEIVTAVEFYQGYVLLGSTLGVRFCSINGDGSLTVGGLIRTDSPVLCFEGQGQYMWFGWTNYDAVSTGLGRLDLQTFVFTLTPAHASDLMATGQGSVSSVVTFGGRRVFAVQGLGIFEESASLVTSGMIDSGMLTYGISDPKVAMFVDVRLADIYGSNVVYLSTDGGPFGSLGSGGEGTSQTLQAGQRTGESFELRHLLSRDASEPTRGPSLSQVTLRAYPKPVSGEVWQVPVLLYDKVKLRNEHDYHMDVAEETARLVALRQSRRLVTAQLGTETFTCLLDDYSMQLEDRTEDGKAFNTVAMLKLKSPAS